MTGQPEAPLNPVGATNRHQRRAQARAIILTPHVVDRLIFHEAHEPGVNAEHAINPAGRHICLGQGYENVVKSLRLHFVAAPTSWLENTKEAGFLHVADCFFRDASFSSRRRRSVGNVRNHRASPGHESFRARSA